MPNTERSPQLADAADVLSDQLKTHLYRISELLAPHERRLARRFDIRLRKLNYGRRERSALSAITLGAAAHLLAARRPLMEFIEAVEYHGRRLAKMNLAPNAVLAALQEYDAVLSPMVASLFPGELTNFHWVRDQLSFCVILTLNNAYYQVRESETQAFYELFRAELEAQNLDDLLKRFVAIMAPVCSADAGQLYILDPATGNWECKAAAGCARPTTNPPAKAATRRKLSSPRYLDIRTRAAGFLDPAWCKRFKSGWSVPLIGAGGTVGVFQLGFKRTYEWLAREQELLAAAAERCIRAAEKARLIEDLAAREEQVRQLAGHMLHVEELERRRISRELHDETGQSLLCVRLQLEMIEESLGEREAECRRKLAETRDLTEKTILEMRRLIAALSPAVLEQLGLGAALRQLVNRFRRIHPARVRLTVPRTAHLPQDTEMIVYRLVQECCNNIAKHSGASHVNISVASADGKVRLRVEDNGVGFRIEEALERRDSFGLSGMRERVALLGGDFELRSFPEAQKRERGTRISIELPISREGRQPAAAETGIRRHAAVLG